MKPDASPPSNFDRPKLLLFKFLAHQIHPFAYAVNTFLQPALDDCRALLHTNPQDTFNVLLSLTQTFLRFAPDAELIYDDIQQFAGKLKDAIDECFAWLDPDTIRQSSQILESTHQSLLTIIQQQNTDKTAYTNMYKNMSSVLTNLEKISSLPVEMQSVALNSTLDTTIPIQKKDTIVNVNGKSDSFEHNINHNGHENASTKRTTMSSFPSPSTTFSVQAEKPSTFVVRSPAKQSQPSPPSPYRSSQKIIIPPPPSPPMTTSITTKLMNQMKDISVSSASIPTTNNVTLASALQSSSSRPLSTVSYLNEYEITDTSTQPTKKPLANIAAFPPRQSSSLFTSTITDTVNEKMLSSDNQYFSSKSSVISKDEKINGHERDIPTPTPSNEGGIRFGTTPGPQITSTASPFHEDDWDVEKSRQYYLDPRFTDPLVASAEWCPAKSYLSILMEQSHINQATTISHPHVTDEYIQEFGTKQNRPALRGDLCMTYGTPQSGPQATCLPIGVGLSYDELTLLSCDVHRNSQNVRLFDIQTGQLKHTIASNQQMKFHRPSAVMSNARNNILIVERDYIYITEPDGRLIQTIGHRSIKQLYGIALFRDRYLLTIDSKATDNQTVENSRLLLFDPNNGQLVFEQRIVINRESEDILKQQNINHIQGKILPETSSKPRFLAVHNDNIYIADLGRSLIYGTSIRNQFEFNCTTVFGGQGRGNGEMTDPSGLFIDSGGNIISADSKNDRIQVFSSDGEYKTTMKLNERIKRPSGICINRAGTQFYVSCYLAGCVRLFNISY